MRPCGAASLVGCLLACTAAAIAQDRGPAASGDWLSIQGGLELSRRHDLNADRHALWDYLRDYLRVEYDQTAASGLRERIVDRWKHAADPAQFSPLLIDRIYTLKAARRLGSVSWQAQFSDAYRACLLPVPRQVILLAYPAPGSAIPPDIYHRHLAELEQLRQRGYLEERTFQRLRDEIQQRGPDRWALAFQLVCTESSADSQEPPLFVVDEGKQIVARFGLLNRPIVLPDDGALSLRIGRPLDDWELPPPQRQRVYLAVDWSGYLQQPARKNWLLKELQFAIGAIPCTWLVNQEIHLHTGEGGTPWTAADLVGGRWPSHMPASVSWTSTLAALQSAAAAADRCQPGVRLVFLTWNPEVSLQSADLTGHSASFLQTEQVVRSMPLRIVQFHGQRLKLFEKLARGKANYDVFDYRPDGPPSLTLFDD